MQSPHRLGFSIEIDVEADRVFTEWTRYETLSRAMPGIRRIKEIDPGRLLWDVDVAGRQIVWEARVVDSVPGRSVRWRTTWGARHDGRVRFESLPDGRTKLRVEIACQPRGLLERLGVWLGVLESHIARNLTSFRRHVERVARDVEHHDPARLAVPLRAGHRG